MDGHCTTILQTSTQPDKETGMLSLARAEAPNYHKQKSKQFYFFANLHWSKAKTLRSMNCCPLTRHSEVIIVHGTIVRLKT